MLVSLLLTFHCCLTGHWLIVSVVPKNPSFFDEEAIFPWRPQPVLASFSIGATTKYSWTWRSSDNLDSQNLCWLGEVCCCLFRLIQKNPSFFFKEATHTRSKLNPSFTCVLVLGERDLKHPSLKKSLKSLCHLKEPQSLWRRGDSPLKTPTSVGLVLKGATSRTPEPGALQETKNHSFFEGELTFPWRPQP